MMIQHGDISPRIRDSSGRTSLSEAAGVGMVAVLLQVVSQLEEQVNKRNEELAAAATAKEAQAALAKERRRADVLSQVLLLLLRDPQTTIDPTSRGPLVQS